MQFGRDEPSPGRFLLRAAPRVTVSWPRASADARSNPPMRTCCSTCGGLSPYPWGVWALHIEEHDPGFGERGNAEMAAYLIAEAVIVRERVAGQIDAATYQARMSGLVSGARR
jgi:hypothetical protein